MRTNNRSHINNRAGAPTVVHVMTPKPSAEKIEDDSLPQNTTNNRVHVSIVKTPLMLVAEELDNERAIDYTRRQLISV